MGSFCGSLFMCAILTCILACEDDAVFPAELVDWDPNSRQLVLPHGGPNTWDRAFSERGYILREGDTYHLWYINEIAGYEWGRLGYASSKDGLSFQKDAGNPIPTPHGLDDVMVLHHGGAYYLFAEGENDEIQMLLGSDPVHFSWRGRVDIRNRDGSPLVPGPYGTPLVFEREGAFFLFYERLDDGVWLARSEDLNTFYNVQDLPVLTIGPADYDAVRISLQQVVAYKGQYYAFYDSRGHRPDYATSVATSKDLIHWHKYPGNPILPVTAGIVVHDGNRFRLYAKGTDGEDVYFSRRLGP